MRILIVEDEKKLAVSLQSILVDEGFLVDVVFTVEEGFGAVYEHSYDLLLLDLGLPDGSGIDLLTDIRQAGEQLSVIILTAKDTTTEKITGLNLGADDYVIKPFEVDELIARIRAVLRRKSEQSYTQLVCRSLVLDQEKRIVTYKKTVLNLSPKEFALLEYLLMHKGQLVSKDQIREHVWGQEIDAVSNIVDVYIGYLRKKLRGVSSKDLITTRKGMGYRLHEH